MAERGLPISTFVKIATSIAAGGVLRTDYGTGLLISTEDGIPAGGAGKIKGYADIEAVMADWTGGEALAASRVWFGGDAEPHSLYIGRWATADVDTTLAGTTPSAAGAAPLNAANASFAINGENLTAIDLSAATTFAAIATALQTALQTVTAFATATFEYDAALNDGAGGFRITAPVVAGAVTAITGGVLSPALDAMGAQVGTDISAALGMDADSNPVYALGHETETLDEALAEMVPQASSGPPTLPMVDGSCPNEVSGVDTRESLATFIQAGDYFAFIRDNGPDALVSGGAGTFRGYVFDNQLSKVEAVVGLGENFGDGTNYPDVAANSFLSSQRFNLPASIKNPHLKSMTGATAILVDGDQLADLVATRTSVYTIVGGVPSLAGGFTGKAGVWADAQYWLGWLKNEMELNIFNAQRGSDWFNTAIMNDTIDTVMAAAERSGGLQPGGRVNTGVRNQIRNTFDRPDFDGLLPGPDGSSGSSSRRPGRILTGRTGSADSRSGSPERTRSTKCSATSSSAHRRPAWPSSARTHICPSSSPDTASLASRTRTSRTNSPGPRFGTAR